jgi:hypothetical protein
MESVYHIVAIRVNETSWAHGWRLRSHYLRTGNDIFGPEVLKDVEKQVQMVCESLKVTQSQQKSYADKRRRDLSFEIGDFVYLKVSPITSTRRFRVKEKLAP